LPRTNWAIRGDPSSRKSRVNRILAGSCEEPFLPDRSLFCAHRRWRFCLGVCLVGERGRAEPVLYQDYAYVALTPALTDNLYSDSAPVATLSADKVQFLTIWDAKTR
jgi:hypothetical protein